MKEAVMKVIDTLTQVDFHGAFQKLLEQYKCIAAGGNYSEKSPETYLMILYIFSILMCCGHKRPNIEKLKNVLGIMLV